MDVSNNTTQLPVDVQQQHGTIYRGRTATAWHNLPWTYSNSMAQLTVDVKKQRNTVKYNCYRSCSVLFCRCLLFSWFLSRFALYDCGFSPGIVRKMRTFPGEVILTKRKVCSSSYSSKSSLKENNSPLVGFIFSFNYFNYQKADDKIVVCEFSKNVKSKQYHIENSILEGKQC